MTISDEAREAFDRLDLTREEVLLASKCIAQRIIDDSADAETPLASMVYDVWGLYNDGSPKCRWTAPYEDEDIVFSAQFRVEGEDAFVVRRKVLDIDEVIDVLREINGDGVRVTA